MTRLFNFINGGYLNKYFTRHEKGMQSQGWKVMMRVIINRKFWIYAQ